MIRALAGNSQF